MPSSLKLISGMAHSEAISAANSFNSDFVSGVLNFGQSFPHLLVARTPIKNNKGNVSLKPQLIFRLPCFINSQLIKMQNIKR